jgi:dihydroneopterin aldolase
MDKIFLRGLQLQAMIGIYPDERISSRPVDIDLEFGVPGKRVFKSGDVADTIDYAAVLERIRDELARVRFGLLEQMSEAIARILLDEFGSPWVRVTIVKTKVLGDGIHVGVSIERRAPRSRASTMVMRSGAIPVGPDYRMLMSERFGSAASAAQQTAARPDRTPS